MDIQRKRDRISEIRTKYADKIVHRLGWFGRERSAVTQATDALQQLAGITKDVHTNPYVDHIGFVRERINQANRTTGVDAFVVRARRYQLDLASFEEAKDVLGLVIKQAKEDPEYLRDIKDTLPRHLDRIANTRLV